MDKEIEKKIKKIKEQRKKNIKGIIQQSVEDYGKNETLIIETELDTSKERD